MSEKNTLQERCDSVIMDIAIDISSIDRMKKEEYIKKVLDMDTLPIGHYPQARVYAMKVPMAVQREGGIEIPSRVTGKTREVVIDKLFDILIKSAPNREGGEATLTKLFDEFIEERKNDKDVAACTIKRNLYDWGAFFKDTPLAHVRVSSIQSANLMEHYKKMTEGRKMTRHAFGNAKGLMNQLFDMAVEQGLVERNLSRELSTRRLKFKPEDCKQDLVYSDEDRERIVDELDGSPNMYDKAIVMQFCLSCRVSEVKALYWSDIDFAHKTVTIRREVVDGDGEQIIKEQTKSGLSEGNRVLPLTERAERVLSDIPKPENKDTLVFQRDYKPLRTQSINEHLKAVCEKLGIRYLSTHKIRAWGITAALEAGMDQASIMRIAGHASPQTMRHYVRTGKIQKDIRENFKEIFD